MNKLPRTEKVCRTNPAPAANGDRVKARSIPLKNESDLLVRLRCGDATAYKEMVDQFSGEMFGLAFSLMGNAADAEDVLQQTFLGAFRGIGAFEGRSSVRTWLTRIVANQASKARRSRYLRSTVSIDAQLVADDTPELQVTGSHNRVDSRLDLWGLLEQLSSEHREILVFRELQGMTYREIARVLRLPRGTIESRLFRARQELRRRFERHFA